MRLIKLQTKGNCYPDVNIQAIAVMLLCDYHKAFGVSFGLDVVTTFENETMVWYGYDEEYERLKKETSALLMEKPELAKKCQKNFFEGAKVFLEFIKKINQTNFSKLSNKELQDLYEDYFNRNRALGIWGEPLPHYTREDVPKFLLKCLNEISKTPSDDLNLLTAPNYVSFTKQEEMDLLKIAIQIKADPENTELKEQLIKEHTKKWFWIPYDYGVTTWDEKHFMDELEEVQDPEKKLKEIEITYKELPKKQQARLKELAIDPHTEEIFQALQICTILMDYKKEVFTKAHYSTRRLHKEIAQRLGLTYEQTKVLLIKEVSQALLENKPPTPEELDGRLKFSVLKLSKDGEYSFVSGEKAKEWVKRIQADEEKSDELTGFPACKGQYTGTVRCILDARNIHELKKGEVLVTYMTSPDYTIGMKKAGAIVTDEGGISSHAAIVSRELGVPCVIGTKHATRVLKTGDRVAVDAEKGVITKL